MGLLDYFTKEGKLKRNVRRMSDRDAQPEDREASLFWLRDEGSPKAIYGLLSRFDMNLTQQLNDASEKEQTFNVLLNLGEPVIGPLKAWLKQCKQFAHPLRMLERLEGEESVIQAVYEILEAEVGKHTFHPEKKKELLVWLAERRHAGAAPLAANFVADFDEEVRYAAAEVLIAQATDDTREPLISMLTNAEEDSNRVKYRVCDVFKARGWSVSGADLCELPPAFTVRDDRIVGS